MPVPSRRRLAALAATALLAAPAPALAQSAGDEQYEDPFAGEDQSQSQPEPTATPAPDAPVAPAEPTPAPEPAAEQPVPAPAATQQQSELPRTGLGVAPILAAGALLLGGGIALRVRLRERS
jgi:LPXTG-motif cell wall-anchored protein